MSDFLIPQTVANQAPLPMGLPRQQYWGTLLFPPPGDFPNPGIKPMSPALQAGSLLLSHWGRNIALAKKFVQVFHKMGGKPKGIFLPTQYYLTVF